MAIASDDKTKLDEAGKYAKSDPGRAEAIYKDILSRDPGSSDAGLRNYELALMGLGELYRDHR